MVPGSLLETGESSWVSKLASRLELLLVHCAGLFPWNVSYSVFSLASSVLKAKSWERIHHGAYEIGVIKSTQSLAAS